VNRKQANREAIRLSAAARAAGLTVGALRPHWCAAGVGRYGCFYIDLRDRDGQAWAVASHETSSSIRSHIGRFRRRP
jgi:hypothetical protein